MIAAAPVSERKRGLINSLSSPHPLGQYLPSLYQEDGFAQRFISAFDTALAPIFVTLDNLTAYLDPWLAPGDFLDWLGSWFGLTLDETWSIERRRALVANAFEFYRMRGTSKGLKAHVEVFTGGTVEIVDTGGLATSSTAGAPFPGSPNFAVLVRVQADEPATVDMVRLEALVAAAKPAHLTHRIQVVKRAAVKDAVEVTSG